MAFWTVVALSLIVFGALLVILRSNIKDISKDPSVTSLTNDTALKMVQIINLNKNRFADNLEGCWNQKNPFTNCIKENAIEPGNYTLHGDKDGAMWLEGPHGQTIKGDIFELSEDQIMMRDSAREFAEKRLKDIPESEEGGDRQRRHPQVDGASYK